MEMNKVKFLYILKPLFIKIIAREKNSGALIDVTNTKFRKGLIETKEISVPPSTRILSC